MQSFRERWQKLADKTKKQLIMMAVGTVLIAGAIIAFLYLSRDTSYRVLFTGLNQDEAQQVVALLQESQVNYQYNDATGSISVPAASVDQTRAQLLSQGYPRSGFSYSMYLDNTGLMSTESDKERLTLYDLQDRLGAQIRLFEGVQDAKVTINMGTSSRYALSDEVSQEASAAVSVTMQNGQVLSETGAESIRRLISTAVRGMNFTEISVFDAGTMQEVGGSASSGNYATASNLMQLTDQVEESIAADVRGILESIYGRGKVTVAVRGVLNMESLIQESTTYSTPEKISETDKTGLLYQESLSGDGGIFEASEAGGVAGSDANADVPRYPNETGDDEETEDYYYGNRVRDWLFNTVKEQRQIDPGVLEDLTISIVIDTDDMTESEANLRNLVANAAGISREDAATKITILRTLSAESRNPGETLPAVQPDPVEKEVLPLPVLIALIALAVLVLLLLILLLLRGRKKKKGEEEQIAATVSPGELGASRENWSEEEFPGASEEKTLMLEEDEEMSQNEELIRLKMQRNLKLKQNIGEIVDQNPQIVAKLVQSWLNEEGEQDGRGRGSDKQKRK